MKTEEAKGWGIRVAGPRPYLAGVFAWEKKSVLAELTQSYYRPVKVVLIPLAEYRRLKFLEKWRS